MGFTIRIARPKQHLQKIFARLIGRAPLLDDAADDLVQFRGWPATPGAQKEQGYRNETAWPDLR